jgi:hypothetical protein
MDGAGAAAGAGAVEGEGVEGLFPSAPSLLSAANLDSKVTSTSAAARSVIAASGRFLDLSNEVSGRIVTKDEAIVIMRNMFRITSEVANTVDDT